MAYYTRSCSILLKLFCLSWLSVTLSWTDSTKDIGPHCGDSKCPIEIKYPCAGKDIKLYTNHPLLVLLIPCLNNETVSTIKHNCSEFILGTNNLSLTSLSISKTDDVTESINSFETSSFSSPTTEQNDRITTGIGGSSILLNISSTNSANITNTVNGTTTTTEFPKTPTTKTTLPMHTEEDSSTDPKASTRSVNVTQQYVQTTGYDRKTGSSWSSTSFATPTYKSTPKKHSSTPSLSSSSKTTQDEKETFQTSRVFVTKSVGTNTDKSKPTNTNYLQTLFTTTVSKLTDTTDLPIKEYSETSTHLPTITFSSIAPTDEKASKRSDLSTHFTAITYSSIDPTFKTTTFLDVSTPPQEMSSKSTDLTASTNNSDVSTPVLEIIWSDPADHTTTRYISNSLPSTVSESTQKGIYTNKRYSDVSNPDEKKTTKSKDLGASTPKIYFTPKQLQSSPATQVNQTSHRPIQPPTTSLYSTQPPVKNTSSLPENCAPAIADLLDRISILEKELKEVKDERERERIEWTDDDN